MTRRIVLAPDSFKGTATSIAAAGAIEAGWCRIRPEDATIVLPMADGGEGTLDALAAAHPDAERRTLEVTGPGSEPVTAQWLLLPDGTAVAELAQSSGLPLLTHPDPCGSHTRGLGEILAAAMDAGARRIIVGLGGSASTDGGTGCLTALGARFLDVEGRALSLGGGSLIDLAQVDLSSMRRPPPEGVVCLVDVTSPLVGPEGAAMVFGPQKGASQAEVDVMDRGLHRLAALLGPGSGDSGAGAAGGTAYGLKVVWGAQLRPGANTVAQLVGLPEAFHNADLLITGEGQFDATSLTGKVVGHLSELARDADVPVAVIAGSFVGSPPAGATVSLSELAGNSLAAMGEPLRWLYLAGQSLAQQFTGGSTT